MQIKGRSEAPSKGRSGPAPWVLVSGSVGTGKTTTSSHAVKVLREAGRPWIHVEVSKLIREERLYHEWDDEMEASIFDEELLGDALCGALAGVDAGGGAVLDFHSVSCFPQSIGLPHAVFVLRAGTEAIWDRLKTRGYSEGKIRENVECEIFGIVAEEAQEEFEDQGVQELQSETAADLERNVSTIVRAATACS